MTPTIGRVVHVHNRPGSYSPGKPEVALVCHDGAGAGWINVAGFDANGDPFKLTSLPFHEHPPTDTKNPRPTTVHACWPPLT